MKKYIVGIPLVILTGCATAPPVPFEGESVASRRLASDAYDILQIYTMGRGCASIDKVETAIAGVPSGEPGSMKIEEQWIAYGCNEIYPYTLGFQEDGQGGTYIVIRAD